MAYRHDSLAPSPQSILATFQSWYINDGEFDLFPEIYFLKPCHGRPSLHAVFATEDLLNVHLSNDFTEVA